VGTGGAGGVVGLIRVGAFAAVGLAGPNVVAGIEVCTLLLVDADAVTVVAPEFAKAHVPVAGASLVVLVGIQLAGAGFRVAALAGNAVDRRAALAIAVAVASVVANAGVAVAALPPGILRRENAALSRIAIRDHARIVRAAFAAGPTLADAFQTGCAVDAGVVLPAGRAVPDLRVGAGTGRGIARPRGVTLVAGGTGNRIDREALTARADGFLAPVRGSRTVGIGAAVPASPVAAVTGTALLVLVALLAAAHALAVSSTAIVLPVALVVLVLVVVFRRGN